MTPPEPAKRDAAILLAAGRGTRARAATADKILAPLAGRPVLAWSVEAFVQSGRFASIAAVYRDKVQQAELRRAIESIIPQNINLIWVQGGAERQDSVLAGLEALPDGTGYVFIHDAARPLLTPKTIERLAAAVRESGAASVARPVTDTIKQAASAGEREPSAGAILRTIDRSSLWAMETPQVFQRQQILTAYREIIASGRSVTDDTAALEGKGTPIALVESDGPNPKLTRDTDFPWVEYLLQQRTEALRLEKEPSIFSPMKIAIGADHAGFQYKQEIIRFLRDKGHEVKDFGTDSDAPVDYPVFIRPVAEAVARGEFERGIVLGGSGNGEAIVANRVPGIRCGLCWNTESARLNRLHNDGNVLSLGQRMMSLETALAIVETWLATPFEGGRHLNRIRLIDAE